MVRWTDECRLHMCFRVPTYWVSGHKGRLTDKPALDLPERFWKFSASAGVSGVKRWVEHNVKLR